MLVAAGDGGGLERQRVAEGGADRLEIAELREQGVVCVLLLVCGRDAVLQRGVAHNDDHVGLHGGDLAK